MKLKTTGNNPLKELLELLPIGSATYSDLATISAVLAKGGVCCETYDEVMVSLTLLGELGLIKIVEENNGYNIIKNYE